MWVLFFCAVEAFQVKMLRSDKRIHHEWVMNGMNNEVTRLAADAGNAFTWVWVCYSTPSPRGLTRDG